MIGGKVNICHKNSLGNYPIFLKFSKNFDRNVCPTLGSCTTIYEHDMWKFTLSDFFFISICWGASPTKIKQLAHLVGCIISTVLISQQYVKFLIRNPAYQNRIAQWSGKLLSRQHLCTGSRWFSMPFFLFSRNQKYKFLEFSRL